MIGETVKDFKITSRLGKGGMGEVWVAEQQIIRTKVAIKMLLAELSRDQELVDRFFNEAIAVSKIRHSGIVKIYDVGFQRGSAYLIMELLEGEALSTRIRRLGRLPLAQVAEIGRQIASVLVATHAAKIIHRDLKPDNVFLIADDELASGERVKVLDFGIAKLGSAVRITGTGTHMGTPGYMAPELWKDAARADVYTDVYALSCAAFEMCCGRLPFEVANIAEAYTKHAYDVPPRARSLAPELPTALDELIARGLAKAPADRPSMTEMQRVFASIVAATGAGPALPTSATATAVDEPADTTAPSGSLLWPAAANDTIAVRPRNAGTVAGEFTARAPLRLEGPRAEPDAAAQPVSTTTLRSAASSRSIGPQSRRWRLLALGGVAAVAAAVALHAAWPVDLHDDRGDSKAAVAIARQDCDRGDQRACVRLASLYQSGTGVARDAASAAKLYQTACDRGQLAGCVNLAGLSLQGSGVTVDNARAATLYQRACDGGEASGCIGLAGLYQKGSGVTRDEVRAAALYRKACESPGSGGCSELGQLYRSGVGVPRDIAAAVALYQTACTGHDMNGCVDLGLLYELGEGVARDLSRAAALYQQACDGGNPAGCSNRGAFDEAGVGVARNAAKAAELFQKACDGASLGGCANLGFLYETGTGLARDPAKATSLYQRACYGREMTGCSNLRAHAERWGVTGDAFESMTASQRTCDAGDMPGCFRLGVLYEYGPVGVLRNPARAFELYRKACDGGQMRSCAKLGVFYEYGVETAVDTAQAFMLYQKACDGDAMTGCSNLGVLYQYGPGAKRDLSRAAALYELACNGNDARGCLNLGRMYSAGTGVAQDSAKAAGYSRKACEGGDPLGCDN